MVKNEAGNKEIPDLTVRVQGAQYDNPLKKMKEDARIAHLVATEITKAMGKAREIKEIGGVGARIKNLMLSGKKSIDHVTLVYETDAEEGQVAQKLAKTFTKEKFYRLK